MKQGFKPGLSPGPKYGTESNSKSGSSPECNMEVKIVLHLMGVFAKNERRYRLTAKNNRF